MTSEQQQAARKAPRGAAAGGGRAGKGEKVSRLLTGCHGSGLCRVRPEGYHNRVAIASVDTVPVTDSALAAQAAKWKREHEQFQRMLKQSKNDKKLMKQGVAAKDLPP